MSDDTPPTWTPPASITIAGVDYPVRVGGNSRVEILVRGRWRSQDMFVVNDAASLRTIAEAFIALAKDDASLN